MSLILDALTRAETDKRKAPNPAVDILAPEHHPMVSGGRRAPWLPVVLALLGGALLTALVLWLFRDGGSEPESGDTSSARSAEAQTTPFQGANAAPSTSGPRASRNDAPRGASVASASQNRDLARPGAQSVSHRDSTLDKDDAESVVRQEDSDRRVAALYATQDELNAEETMGAESSGDEPASIPELASAEPDEPVITETPVNLDAVLREVREDARIDGLEPHAAPLLGDLSQQFRNRVPTLMYLRHDYSELGRSTVLMNGQTLAVGQRTRGVEVRDVLGDSVILRFEGTEFRLRALNSWVNL